MDAALASEPATADVPALERRWRFRVIEGEERKGVVSTVDRAINGPMSIGRCASLIQDNQNQLGDGLNDR